MAGEKATLGGGCFWCVEAAFQQIEGIEEAVPGYAGGDADDPTYRQVCTGRTGHAEVVQVTFDPEVLDYRTVLEIFFSVHDPTQRNRQGPDVGTQYRSIVLLHSDEQRRIAEEVIDDLEGEVWEGIVTEVEPLERFWPAEPEHHDYFERNPEQAYCRSVIEPKLEKLRDRWRDRIRA